MKFGKLTNIEDVDFRLPPDPAINTQVLESNPHQSIPSKIYLGCTGWNMKDWVGAVYPKGTKTKDFLKAYSQQFNTIELNTTHYRIPSLEIIHKWYNESKPDFRFCPKIPQSISHSRNLGLGTELIPAFSMAIEELKEKLGCCFMQLPPYFDTSRLSVLKNFIKAFPSHIPLAIEVRHESWFQSEANKNALFDLLTDNGLAAVITDVAGRRDVLHMGITSPITMIRFVGNGLHATDYSRADEWVQRLKSWVGPGLHEVYLFPHEPDNVLAPQMAAYFLAQINKHIPEASVRGPQLIDYSDDGEQMSLF
jgi:uncharacterized protein YecE (DUF72 family)